MFTIGLKAAAAGAAVCALAGCAGAAHERRAVPSTVAPPVTTPATVRAAGPVVYAACDGSYPEVWYVVPGGGPFPVRTFKDGVLLAAWEEPAGPHTPVVVGPGGGRLFTVEAAGRSTSVPIPAC